MYEELKGKTILVTGGAGFIGSHLCERLLDLGAKVICFDNLSTGRVRNLSFAYDAQKAASTNPNFVFIQGDVNVADDIRQVFLSYPIDYVFHYAAVVGVKRVWEKPFAVFKDIEGFNDVLDLSVMRGVKKVVFSSSSEAYGEPVERFEREDGIHNPGSRNAYALTKLVGENLFLGYYEKYKLPTAVLRFFNVYGPKQESSAYGFVAGVFIKQVLEGKNPTIFGDGKQTRDFVYVDDNIDLAIRALLSDKTNGEVINVGKGKPTAILELAEQIIKLSGKDLRPEFLPARPNDIKYRNPDITKMKRLLDAEPQVNLEEGLKKTFEWYKENVKL
jgi:UDP-glucuronate decarboxylase